MGVGGTVGLDGPHVDGSGKRSERSAHGLAQRTLCQTRAVQLESGPCSGLSILSEVNYYQPESRMR